MVGQHAVPHVAVDLPKELENVWDQMNSVLLSLANLLKPVPVMAVKVAISFLNGHHVQLLAAQVNKLVLSPIHVLLKLATNHKFAQITQVSMVPGLLGPLVLQPVVAASKPDQSNIHVAVKITSKSELAMKTLVIMNNGVNGLIALSHVVVEMLSVNVSTAVPAKFKPIQNSVTLIHAVTTVPGPTGPHAVPLVASVPCLE